MNKGIATLFVLVVMIVASIVNMASAEGDDMDAQEHKHKYYYGGYYGYPSYYGYGSGYGGYGGYGGYRNNYGYHHQPYYGHQPHYY